MSKFTLSFLTGVGILLLSSGCSHVRVGIPFTEGSAIDGLRVAGADTLQKMRGLDVGINNRVTEEFIGLSIDPAHRVRGKSTGLHLGGYSEVQESKDFTAQIGVANRLNSGDLAAQVGLFNFVECEQGGQIGFINHGRFNEFGGKIGLLNISQENSGALVGFMNLSRKSDGVTIGVINQASSADASHEGWTLGLLNHAHETKGSQVGVINVAENPSVVTQLGVVNYARGLSGLQVGLINYAPGLRSPGVQLGFLNLGQAGAGAKGFPVLFRAKF